MADPKRSYTEEELLHLARGFPERIARLRGRPVSEAIKEYDRMMGEIDTVLEGDCPVYAALNLTHIKLGFLVEKTHLEVLRYNSEMDVPEASHTR